MYGWALLVPVVCVMAYGKPWQTALNLILMITGVGYPIAILHAVLLTQEHHHDRRHAELLAALQAAGRVPAQLAQ